MRLDKFLKVSRIIKRRTASKEFASSQRVMVNQKVVKPSYKLSVGDILELQFGSSVLKVKVLNLINSTKKEDATKMYEIIED